jgi:Fe-S-cluster-containing dehydrogenase component
MEFYYYFNDGPASFIDSGSINQCDGLKIQYSNQGGVFFNNNMCISYHSCLYLCNYQIAKKLWFPHRIGDIKIFIDCKWHKHETK